MIDFHATSTRAWVENSRMCWAAVTGLTIGHHVVIGIDSIAATHTGFGEILIIGTLVATIKGSITVCI